MKNNSYHKALSGNKHEIETGNFKSLNLKENHDINNVEGDNGRRRERYGPFDNTISSIGNTGEPWVAFTPHDRVGLALSGGGIRSATFNLGLMQALVHKGLLKRVDYLATVSGGGFIGGFWTRWWKSVHVPNAARKHRGFPESLGGAVADLDKEPKETREPHEIRHLREFSRYLIPRSGLNRDLWSAVISVFSGLVPSLIAALALVFFIVTVWAFLAGLMLTLTNPSQAVQFAQVWLPEWMQPTGRYILLLTCGLFTILIGFGHVLTECLVRCNDNLILEPSERGAYTKSYITWSILGLALVNLCWIGWNYLIIDPFSVAGLDGIEAPYSRYNFNYFLFGPCLVLVATLLILKQLKLILMRIDYPRSMDPDTQRGPLFARLFAFERVMGLLLIIMVAWAAMSGIWELARWLNVKAEIFGEYKAVGSGGVSAVLAMLFAWTRRWLIKPKQGNQVSGILPEWLKPWIPQILANLTVISFFVLAALFILTSGLKDGVWPDQWFLLGPIGVIMVVVLLLDPSEMGLHEFYRSRLTRCYLGASNPNPSKEQVSMECAADDMRLKEDVGLPIHLICCTANQLWGDPLSTLHRGARSAVLSRNGIAIGNSWMEDDSLRLSSAMTASAAAFNSLMGEVNMKVGQAVAFVMTALNLRLGLWVRNPAYHKDKKGWGQYLPGLLFFKEMCGHAQCFTDKRATSHMHLSDGGHFENLALYELIRRHCRYIIVSDAGEDKAFDFSDFGRAARRVREDFGVEIEIEIFPIKPGPDGFSRQHIAVGTIHYDGIEGMDKGTILYFKPTLTGDEPVDVLQYKKRNPHFPHESTGDQFYDEAQWESYRRLGEHTGHAGLRMLEQLEDVTGNPIPGPQPKDPLERMFRQQEDAAESLPVNETLFREIRLAWHRVPWMEGDGGILLNEKEVDLEKALKDMRRPELWQEYMGDMIGASNDPLKTEQTAEDIVMAIRALKFIEEAWFTCDLERYWSHPLASNWMSYLQRWAAMPTLHRWWPFLKSLFGASKGFVAFAENQLNLPKSSPGKAHKGGTLHLNLIPHLSLDGFAWKRFIEYHPEKLASYSILKHFSLVLSLSLPHPLKIQVGVGLINEDPKVASWCFDDLFVPPELHGCGFTTMLLDLIIKEYKDKTPLTVECLEVQMENCTGKAAAMPVNRRDPAWRQKQIELIDFYRSRGFKLEMTSWIREGQSINMSMHLH